MSTFGSQSEDGIAMRVRSCHSNLLALHAEYSSSLERLSGSCIGSKVLDSVLMDARDRQDSLAISTQDAQLFLDLVKLCESLEGDRTRFFNEKTELAAENTLLKEEVERLTRNLTLSEENVIQLESDKQELEFMNRLLNEEKEIMDSRMSESHGEEVFATGTRNLLSPGMKLALSPSIRPLSSGYASRRHFRNSEDRSPLTKLVTNKQEGGSVGNFTLYMGESAIEVDELDELTDKLGWYESIMRQLMDIFGTEREDPDVTYHEESTNIVQRAKRTVEYRDMIRHYEKTIDEQRKAIEKLDKELADARSRGRRALTDATPKILNQIPVSFSSFDASKRKSSR